MAQAIDHERKRMRELIARHAGQGQPQAYHYAAQSRTSGNQAEFWALPVDVSQWQVLGVTDPTSPYYGRTYYLPGYHPSGDTFHPHR